MPILCAGILAVASAGVARSGGGFSERHRALDGAERAGAVERARGPAEHVLRQRAGRPEDRPERVELLRVVRHPSPKGEPPADYRRRADAYFYDYDADRIAVVTVDLEGGRIESVRTGTDVQPPLNEREVARAMDLLFADADAAARIGEEFARITGHPLSHRNELMVSGFVYHAESMPESNSPDTQDCGRHRCAQLLLRTQDNVAIEVPIVDLSRERLLETRRFGPPQPEPGGHDAHGAHDHAH